MSRQALQDGAKLRQRADILAHLPAGHVEPKRRNGTAAMPTHYLGRVRNSGIVDPQRTGSEGHGPVYRSHTVEELRKESFERFAFNEYESRQQSVNRTVPDIRNEACRRRNYDLASMPRASVVICFVDEAWSVLMRSVWSVINRSPPELLHEVLLVDDASDAEWCVHLFTGVVVSG